MRAYAGRKSDDPAVSDRWCKSRWPTVRIVGRGRRCSARSAVANSTFCGSLPPSSAGPSAGSSARCWPNWDRLIGASRPPADWPAALHTVVAAVPARPFQDQAACIAGLSEALRLRRGATSGSALQAVIGQQNGGDAAADRKFFDALFAEALKNAVDHEQPVELRSAAVSLLADADPNAVGEPLLALVDPHEPPGVQSSAVRALKNLEEPAVAARLLEPERFRGYSPPLARSGAGGHVVRAAVAGGAAHRHSNRERFRSAWSTRCVAGS